MARDDFPDVDFVVGRPDSGADEDLPEPKDREWTLLRRAKRPLGIAAVIAVAVLGAVKLASLGDGTSTAAAPPTPTPLPSHGYVRRIDVPRPEVFPSTVEPVPVGSGTGRIFILPGGSGVVAIPGPPVRPDDPAACLPGVSCISSDSVPADVLAAIRAAFPGARPLSAGTVLTHFDGPGSKLWFRQVNARAGNLDILVRVQQPRSNDRPHGESTDHGDGAIAYLETHEQGLTVQVQVDAPSGHVTALAKLRALAADRRLLVEI